jgi:hypothetical protein
MTYSPTGSYQAEENSAFHRDIDLTEFNNCEMAFPPVYMSNSGAEVNQPTLSSMQVYAPSLAHVPVRDTAGPVVYYAHPPWPQVQSLGGPSNCPPHIRAGTATGAAMQHVLPVNMNVHVQYRQEVPLATPVPAVTPPPPPQEQPLQVAGQVTAPRQEAAESSAAPARRRQPRTRRTQPPPPPPPPPTESAFNPGTTGGARVPARRRRDPDRRREQNRIAAQIHRERQRTQRERLNSRVGVLTTTLEEITRLLVGKAERMRRQSNALRSSTSEPIRQRVQDLLMSTIRSLERLVVHDPTAPRTAPGVHASFP